MDTIQQFFSAVMGSAVMEVYDAYRLYHSGHYKLPQRYQSGSFYLVCLLAAIAAGYLALILPCQNAWQSFAVGVCAPKIIAKLAKSGFFKGQL
jgi:hypothetical protein